MKGYGGTLRVYQQKLGDITEWELSPNFDRHTLTLTAAGSFTRLWVDGVAVERKRNPDLRLEVVLILPKSQTEQAYIGIVDELTPTRLRMRDVRGPGMES